MNVSTGFLKAWIIAIFVLALSGCPKDEQFLVVNATGMSLDIIGDDHVVMIPDGQSKEVRRGDGLLHWVKQGGELFPSLRVRIEEREFVYSMTDEFYRAAPGKQIAMRFDRSNCATIFHIDDQVATIASNEPPVGLSLIHI